MESSRATSLMAVLTFILLGTFLGTVILAAPKPARAAAEDDSAAVKSVISGFTESFNRHDAHAVAMWFTDEADFTNVGQVTSHGRKSIEEHFVPLFAGRLKNAHRTCTVRAIRFLNPTVASVAMDYELARTIDANGSEVPLRKGFYDWIVTKQNGKWLIDVLHESELAQAPAVMPVR